MSLETSLRGLLSRAAEAGDVPGVTAAVGTRDKVLFEGAAGKRAADQPAAATADSVMFFASTTKAITAAAAMQQVERGKLSLDEPAGKWVPELAAVQVVDGVDASGAPKMRPPKRPVTLRNLLTHSAGFAYEIWNADVLKYLETNAIPNILSGSRTTFNRPLLRDPDTRWEYSPGIDYAGLMVEASSGERLGEFVRKNLFDPLGMKSTGYRITPAQRERMCSMHARTPEGTVVYPFEIDQKAEIDMGGHACYGTAPDYLRFLRMIINGGTLDGTRVLQAATVKTMSQNQMGELRVKPLHTVMPPFSHDCDFYPTIPCTWGLSFLINTETTPEGRSPGSLSWAGLCNSYYWADPVKGVAGVMMSQVLPFFDDRIMKLFRSFESTVYQSL